MSSTNHSIEIITPPDATAIFESLFGISLARFDHMCQTEIGRANAMAILQGKPIVPGPVVPYGGKP